MSQKLRRIATRRVGCLLLLALLTTACGPGGNRDNNEQAVPAATPSAVTNSGQSTDPVTVTTVAQTDTVLRPDAATTMLDTAVVIPVLANDSFASGAPSLIALSAPGHGTATIDDNGTPNNPADDAVVYTPQAGHFGPDSFIYTVADGAETGQAVVEVTVGAGPVTAGVEVCGAVFKGPLAGALVGLYAVDASGDATGAPLAQTLTSDDGTWCARVPAAREPLLIASSGGSFRNEADSDAGQAIVFAEGDGLETMLPADASYAAVTIYSNALLHRARVDGASDDFFDVFSQRRAVSIPWPPFPPIRRRPPPTRWSPLAAMRSPWAAWQTR